MDEKHVHAPYYLHTLYIFGGSNSAYSDTVVYLGTLNLFWGGDGPGLAKATCTT